MDHSVFNSSFPLSGPGEKGDKAWFVFTYSLRQRHHRNQSLSIDFVKVRQCLGLLLQPYLNVLVFILYTAQSLPHISFSHGANSSLSSQQNLTGTFLLSVSFSVLSSLSSSFFTSLCLSHSLPCCFQMAGFAQGLQAGIEHAWNNMFLLNLPSLIAS